MFSLYLDTLVLIISSSLPVKKPVESSEEEGEDDEGEGEDEGCRRRY